MKNLTYIFAVLFLTTASTSGLSHLYIADYPQIKSLTQEEPLAMEVISQALETGKIPFVTIYEFGCTITKPYFSKDPLTQISLGLGSVIILVWPSATCAFSFAILGGSACAFKRAVKNILLKSSKDKLICRLIFDEIKSSLLKCDEIRKKFSLSVMQNCSYGHKKQNSGIIFNNLSEWVQSLEKEFPIFGQKSEQIIIKKALNNDFRQYLELSLENYEVDGEFICSVFCKRIKKT